MDTKPAASQRVYWVLTYSPLLLIVAFLVRHVLPAMQDFVTAIGSPMELDYGEGIVWQQAALIPGPLMYSRSQALPFIVFHYPPLFHLLTQAAAAFMPSLLAAGRLVSVTATLSIAVFVGALAGLATRVRGRNWLPTDVLAMMIAGMLVPCLHVVHFWGMVMRVDSAAIAFAFAGVLVGIRGDGRLTPTTAGMLLCLCAVFTKQTQVSAGIARFVVTFLRALRPALLAAAIIGGVGLGFAGLLQWVTHGGFFLNILEYNINRFSFQVFLDTYYIGRTSVFVGIAALASIPILLGNSWRGSNSGTNLPARLADRATAYRTLLVTYLFFSTLTLVTTFKSGSNFNYLFEWLAVACAILGVGIADLARKPCGFAARFALLALLSPVLVFLMVMPTQPLAFLCNSQALELRERLVERIASATKPAASDNMTLLMQAGKRVIFEPVIATELAELGIWDEKPLVDMIRGHGFAFIMSTGDPKIRATGRTPAVNAAIAEGYPRVEQVGRNNWVYSPP